MTDVFEKMRLVSERLDKIEEANAGELWTIERLRAVLATIQNADVTYGVINDGGESVTPMMVERDAIVDALYGLIKPAVVEYVWLLERGQGQNHKQTVYWSGDPEDGWGGWVENAWKAQRFATKEAAEAVVREKFWFRPSIPPTADVVQHGFDWGTS